MTPATTASGTDTLLGDLAQMARIRAFEERVSRHFRAGDIPGFVHVSIGQEAIAAGVWVALATFRAASAHSSHVALGPGSGILACSNKVLLTNGPVIVICDRKP